MLLAKEIVYLSYLVGINFPFGDFFLFMLLRKNAMAYLITSFRTPWSKDTKNWNKNQVFNDVIFLIV